MNVLSWNCRGLGSPRTVRVLSDLIKSRKPDVLFLSETISTADKIEHLRVKFGFSHCFTVDRIGRSGGLGVFWRNNAACEITGYSQNHVDINFMHNNVAVWRLSCFYGFSERTRRQNSWDLIRVLAGKSDLPWYIMGDFNDLLYESDKWGRLPHPRSLLEGFRKAIDDSLLAELHLHEGKFTQEKCQGKPEWVKKRLDRCFATQTWWNLFQLCKLFVDHDSASDHDPLFLDLVNVSFSRKFFASVSGFMARWGRNFFHKFRDKVKKQKDMVASLSDRADMIGVERAKNYWLTEGDANIKFFHATASVRKKTNHIAFLENDLGEQIQVHEKMCHMVKDYFTEVFTSKRDHSDIPELISNRGATMTQNADLVADLTFDEFTITVKQMHPDKASGPDGLNPAFFQQLWSILGHEAFHCCKEWLTNCSFSANLNDTNVVLIPKKENASCMKDLRPIALCNVLYKIVAKVLSNRLKLILPTLISEHQSAFVPGRSITDNVLVAFEIIHHMQRKKTREDGEIALKLDISKAYDRVDWDFLKVSMRGMGFSQKWIDWMMLCITTVSYEFSFNGSSVGPIQPTRGLRQGDPLSPYLFLLCVEGLSNSLSNAAREGIIHGSQICPAAPVVTHLLFADDSFLFFCADRGEAETIKELLNTYKNWSGKPVNFQKSGIHFSSNIQQHLRMELSTILGVTNNLYDSKYLGLPSLVGRSKNKVFGFVKATQQAGAIFIWSGLMAAKDSLCNGFRWVLGDGLDINTIKDPWLRKKEDFIMTHGREWDEPKVMDLFSENDAKLILETRIPYGSAKDRIAWTHSTDGNYTVKAGYQYWRDVNMSNTRVVQCSGWGVLWRLNVPHKHVGVLFDMSTVEYAHEWLLQMLNTSCQDELIQIARVLWGIWFFRNKKVWDEKLVTGRFAIEWSMKYFTDWNAAKASRVTTPTTSTKISRVSAHKWKPPVMGSLKLNVDATLKLGEATFIVGLILRDHEGKFIL
ncbi:uncharacterized protein LOC141685822 [Apium graveolens]|uniref:uncharacterized protein LOC141685822 n=1 Tax=Apium graveolens TaxID=4045 RepID=UPI003D79B9D7